ncbi:MAG TPA: hypothetical protein VGC47_04975 [Acidimicrobiia bacterium]|jgi:hypothetical protein
MNTTLDEVRNTAIRLADAVESEAPRAAEKLRAAAADPSDSPDALLGLRSALIETRPAWEECAGDHLAGEARAVLRSAKRLAIEM